jgi:2-(1,2-epoxy-1,2-dihydrophenyl)acetyl-CoA isomerase
MAFNVFFIASDAHFAFFTNHFAITMAYEFLIYTVQDKVATITMNRPDALNALNNELTFELQEAFKETAKDKNVRAVVLTGAGKGFCSGQDLKAARGADFKGFSDSIHKRYNPLIRAMRNLPKPIVCKLNGVAAGAGASLALACDFIVASEKASIIEVFINIGLVMDSGSSFFLPRLVGPQRAFEYATMATKITAEEAFRLGMVNRVVAHDELDKTTADIANFYANAPTKAIGLMKKMINKSLSADLDTMLEYEAYMQDIAGASYDYKEGVNAFLEKRKPEFKGE